MQHKLLDTAGKTLAWLAAIAACALALTTLWFSRHQPILMDLAMMHYSAFLINEKHLLLYRDIFENNFPGPFFFHALIGKVFGYSAHPVRFLDACILFTIGGLSWIILQPISRASALLAPSLFACLYFSGHPVAAFQRDYIAIVPLALALALLLRPLQNPLQNALIIGSLGGLACGFKPNFIVVIPALYWLLLEQIPGPLLPKAVRMAVPLGTGFIALFAIPFLWALRHADLAEMIALYKTYTPLYVSTRTDLYHYDSPSQQWHDLLRMQIKHLGQMALFSLPGLLWAWRQQRDNPAALHHLRYLAIITFAIAWHEVIAGKYWFSHLLPPYFFVALCFSLLLTPAHNSARLPEKMLRLVFALIVIAISITAGRYSSKVMYDAHYDDENYNIRSKKIARYLQMHLKPGDKVQALDGSGDGQGSLLLAGATTATRFVEDIPLYLQPDATATQHFRREFLDALQSSPPAFFVYIHNFFHPAGGNRLQEFHELNEFIGKNYDEVETEDGEYTIYQRKPELPEK